MYSINLQWNQQSDEWILQCGHLSSVLKCFCCGHETSSGLLGVWWSDGARLSDVHANTGAGICDSDCNDGQFIAKLDYIEPWTLCATWHLANGCQFWDKYALRMHRLSVGLVYMWIAMVVHRQFTCKFWVCLLVSISSNLSW